jgi:hypothetical protein
MVYSHKKVKYKRLTNKILVENLLQSLYKVTTSQDYGVKNRLSVFWMS